MALAADPGSRLGERRGRQTRTEAVADDRLLSASQAQRLGPLVSIGGQSGDTVVGLSAVRRARHLAFVFVAAATADNTWRELLGREARGAQVLRVEDMAALTRGLGREDASIVGVKAGALAEGMARRLAAGHSESETR